MYNNQDRNTQGSMTPQKENNNTLISDCEEEDIDKMSEKKLTLHRHTVK